MARLMNLHFLAQATAQRVLELSPVMGRRLSRGAAVHRLILSDLRTAFEFGLAAGSAATPGGQVDITQEVISGRWRGRFKH